VNLSFNAAVEMHTSIAFEKTGREPATTLLDYMRSVRNPSSMYTRVTSSTPDRCASLCRADKSERTLSSAVEAESMSLSVTVSLG